MATETYAQQNPGIVGTQTADLPGVGRTTVTNVAPPPAQTAAQRAAAATTTTNTNNAVNSISATLDSLGLGGMSSWATATVSALVGQGIDPTTAVNTVISQMNAPQNADGSVNQGALDAFNTALPGFNELITKTGQNGSPGSSPAQAIANYISYSSQIQQFQTQAGLVPGTITAADIGNLWAGQVSSAEVSQRITDATNVANNAPQQVQDYLANNFGMTTTALTSYYLNPTNTLNTIQSNINTGMIGGESSITGFGALSVAQSRALGAFLANGTGSASGSGIGTVNPITAGSANAFFTNNLSSSTSGAVSGSLAQLGGLESATPGTMGTVTTDQLIAAGEGQAQATQAVSLAQQTRTAGSRGGGGETTTANGALGLGYSQSD